MKRKLLLLMLAAGTLLTAQVSLGVRIGPPPIMRMERVDNRRPGPDYVWVDGYWYPERNRYTWHKGYWTRAPFGGARWIAPRHDQGMYYNGYWGNNNDRFDHDHRWDRDRDRDNGRRR